MELRIMIFLYTIAVVLIVGGVLILFAPKFLIKISEPLNKEFGEKRKGKTLISTDERVFENRHVFGPIIFITGLILIYISFSLL